MAKRGPKAMPKTIKVARGSWRANKAAAGPEGDHKRPACPQRFIRWAKTESGERVRREAKRTWDRLVRKLHADGLATENNRETLAALCDAQGRFVEACLQCDLEGMTIETDKGNLIQSPWVAIRNKMYEQIYKGAACYGLTPADLAGVTRVKKPADESKSKFFKRSG